MEKTWASTGAYNTFSSFGLDIQRCCQYSWKAWKWECIAQSYQRTNLFSCECFNFCVRTTNSQKCAKISKHFSSGNFKILSRLQIYGKLLDDKDLNCILFISPSSVRIWKCEKSLMNLDMRHWQRMYSDETSDERTIWFYLYIVIVFWGDPLI